MAIKQLTVFVENKQGALVAITDALSKNEINLRALSIAETSDYGVLRIIANETEKAVDILLKKGCILSKTPVYVVAVPDEPAGLAKILEFLAERNVDIEYMYSLFTHKEGNAYMVMRVSDDPKFLSTLGDRKIKLMTKEELGLK